MTASSEWPLYRGTKTLRAIPMNKRDYCTYRGWSVPADEDPEELGYMVEYQDGGKPNMPAIHAGYVSWSPADVFERAYRPTDPAAQGTEALRELEAECAAGRTFPRVSLDDLTANIVAVSYSRGPELVYEDLIRKFSRDQVASLAAFTLCTIVLKNGFVIIGKSAPAHPSNFSKELGEKLAYDDAVKQVWPLMGYALKEQLSQPAAGEDVLYHEPPVTVAEPQVVG